MTIQMMSIDAIRLDERCQPRMSINPEVIDEYAEAMTQGAEFPPLTVYRDGSTFWLADGFHRIAAAKYAGRQHVVCDVQQGTIRDAILHAVGANANHGMRRTNADKRRAVETLLKDDEWARWSDNKIADSCGVSVPFVGKVRSSLSTVNSEPSSERTYTDRYGNTRTMNTANIGRRPEREAVDEDTGEILDNTPPPYQEADPSDPATWFTPAPRQIAPPQPVTTPTPVNGHLSFTFRDYGASHRRLTARSIALALDAEFGDGFAELVGQEARAAKQGAA